MSFSFPGVVSDASLWGVSSISTQALGKFVQCLNHLDSYPYALCLAVLWLVSFSFIPFVHSSFQCCFFFFHCEWKQHCYEVYMGWIFQQFTYLHGQFTHVFSMICNGLSVLHTGDYTQLTSTFSSSSSSSSFYIFWNVMKAIINKFLFVVAMQHNPLGIFSQFSLIGKK